MVNWFETFIEFHGKYNIFIDFFIPVFGFSVAILVAKRTIKNSNKELKLNLQISNQPILILQEMEIPPQTDFVNSRVLYLDNSLSEEDSIKVMRKLIFRNIGKGPAINIQFYNLATAEKLDYILRSDNTSDVASFPTDIIPALEDKEFNLVLKHNLKIGVVDKNKKYYNSEEFIYLVVYDDIFSNSKNLILYISLDPNTKNIEYSIILSNDRNYAKYKEKYKDNWQKIYNNVKNRFNIINKEEE